MGEKNEEQLRTAKWSFKSPEDAKAVWQSIERHLPHIALKVRVANGESVLGSIFGGLGGL